MKQNLTTEMVKALQIDAELCAKVPCKGPSDLVAYRQQYNYARAYWNRNGPKMRDQHDWLFEHNGASIPCRTHVPELAAVNQPSPAIIFFHGGGWVLGNLETHDRMMRELAHRTGFLVIGIDYKLSPESRFPQAHNESVAFIKHLLDQPDVTSIDANNISLCGDSAGAHMSLYCALQIAKSHPGKLRSLNLIYGAYGLRDSISHRTQGTPEVGLSADDMKFYRTALLGENADPVTSGFDLLDNDFSAIPASLVTCCMLDPLHDDSIVLCSRLDKFGIDNRLLEYPGVLHGYAHMSEEVSEARDTLQQCANWITKYSI